MTIVLLIIAAAPNAPCQPTLPRPCSIYPYAYYFCRKQLKAGEGGGCCGCTSLDYPFTQHHRQCDKCGHSPLSHYCWWNRWGARVRAGGWCPRALNRIMKHSVAACLYLGLGRCVSAAPGRRTYKERRAECTRNPLANSHCGRHNVLASSLATSPPFATRLANSDSPIRRFVANPIKNHGYQGRGRTAMQLLKNRIMPAILLRRTKVRRTARMVHLTTAFAPVNTMPA